MNVAKPRVLILTWGSMGDILPLIALGKQLQKDGHHVTLGASSFFATLVHTHGIDFRPIGTHFTYARYNQVMDAVKAEPNPRKQMQFLLQQVLLSDLERQYVDCRIAVQEADVVLAHWMQIAGSMAAEAEDKPLATVTFNPVGISTISDPRDPMQARNIGRAFSDFLWGDTVHDFRARMGLRQVSSVTESQYSPHLNLVAVSRHLLPEHRKWPQNHQAVGFWHLEDEDWTPDARLTHFLEAGDKPVVFSFGSMAGTDAIETTQALIDAVDELGGRAIVQAGWAGLGEADLPDNILSVGYAPHHWLFSRAACVVHHGGAGTTAAALRAGTPSVIVWHMLDQPYWGNLLAQLGLGPKPLSRLDMNAQTLAACMHAALRTEAFAPACRAMAQNIAGEGGVREAARRLNDFASQAFAGRRYDVSDISIM